MWARRAARSPRRNASGVARIKRDTYNSIGGGLTKKNGWWEINAKVVKRSGGKCEALLNGFRCGAKASEVHHIIALSRGGTTTMGNLIHLCMGCHDRRHAHLFKLNRK